VRVRQLREERGWTATELAIRSGVGLAELSLIERNAIGLGLKRAARLAAALKVDVDDLFHRSLEVSRSGRE
jgi:transcriptional regulator with XRE-family HTH domain